MSNYVLTYQLCKWFSDLLTSVNAHLPPVYNIPPTDTTLSKFCLVILYSVTVAADFCNKRKCECWIVDQEIQYFVRRLSGYVEIASGSNLQTWMEHNFNCLLSVKLKPASLCLNWSTQGSHSSLEKVWNSAIFSQGKSVVETTPPLINLQQVETAWFLKMSGIALDLKSRNPVNR